MHKESSKNTRHWLNSQVLRSRRNVTADNLGWRRLTGKLFQTVDQHCRMPGDGKRGEGRRGLGVW